MGTKQAQKYKAKLEKLELKFAGCARGEEDGIEHKIAETLKDAIDEAEGYIMAQGITFIRFNDESCLRSGLWGQSAEIVKGKDFKILIDELLTAKATIEYINSQEDDVELNSTEADQLEYIEYTDTDPTPWDFYHDEPTWEDIYRESITVLICPSCVYEVIVPIDIYERTDWGELDILPCKCTAEVEWIKGEEGLPYFQAN